MILKQKIGAFFLLIFLIGSLFSVSYASAVTLGSGLSSLDSGTATAITSSEMAATVPAPEPVMNAALNTAGFLESSWIIWVKPMLQGMAVSAIFDMVSYASDTLAKNTAVWLANGAPGQEPLFQSLTGYESWKTFGLDLAADGLGSLSQVINDYYDINFNLCAPEEPLFRLGLQIGIQGMYQPRKPKCEWQAVAENWDGFIQNTLESTEDPTGQALNMLAKSFQPGQTSLAYLTIVNNKIIFKVDEKKNADFMESLFSLGFKPVTDPVTGVVRTPSQMVAEQMKLTQYDGLLGKNGRNLDVMLANEDIWSSIAYQSIKIFTTTLVGTFIQNLQTGFFNTEDIIDPFSELSENSSTSVDAEEFYADLISTTPVSLTDYNILSEFAVCPQSPSIRQLNNCVTDASLVQGINRSFGTEVVTVASALEAGYLHGDWPLYPPDDKIHNQDPLCYTYGYCYGNLVKLRKARIISVGWEMAANSIFYSGNTPPTLQAVVDGFNSCNSDGQASESFPWCHMIDPNWLLKYPQQNCEASMIGEIAISSMISARSATCVDSPSCLAENDDGTCEAYGNCVREKNTWDFNGDSCPEESLSCLNFTNSDSSETGTWLFNSLDQGVCSAANAGCLWYRTNKYLDNGGTADDVSDDAYEWLPGDEVYTTATRDDSMQYYNGTSYSTRASFDYDTDADGVDDDGSYNIYAFEDRAYFNSEVETCTESEAGCSEIYAIGDDELSLNIIRNPSFEDDEDDDGLADLWSVSTTSPPVYNESDTSSQQGNSNYLLSGGDVLYQNDIPLQQNHSYVLSFYAKGAVVGNVVTALLTLKVSDNSAVSLTGYSSNCTTSAGNRVTKLATTTSATIFTSYECTFNTPILTNDRLWIVADLSFRAANGTYVDAIQIEASETASGFHTAYNDSEPTTAYLQIPPDWLGCTGEATDPADCANYTQVCSATEVGCSLYTPSDGDPAVPAVISDGDQCPSECVGYATYKQESTDYDTGEFPLYFIADSAQTCSSSSVGCDEFTNLETEGIEAYSHLRACLTSEMAGTNSEVFFTWEGSDMTGYQLVSYQLLSSNLVPPSFVDTDGDSALDTDEDSTPGNAPCTIWDVASENTLVCQDSVTVLALETTCTTHDDISTNPDCREFYDSLGDIHYRLYSETISISDVCTAYRKTDANVIDCNDSGGYWTGSGECRYFIEPNESTVCSTSSAGCREYTGGGSRNSSTVLTDYFENGTYDSYVKVGTTNSTLTISNESVAVDGHSLRVSATAAGDGFATLQDYYNANRTSVCATDGGCAAIGGLCTVENGAESCGTLVDELVAGKTYVLKFWAKGSGNIGVALTEQGGTTGGKIRNLAASVPDCETAPTLSVPDCHTAPTSITNLTSVALSGSWQLYELGPLDTSLLTNFDDNAILGFYSLSAGAQTFYIDNIQLEQTEENLTLIKNSWVTPSTCDETSVGAVSEQYYLGCEEYADQNNSTYNIYRFSSICSEGAVGCDDFYVTQNSEATYAQIFNATCYNPVNTDGDLFFAYTAHGTEEDAVASATSCALGGVDTYGVLVGTELCTIIAGHNQCQFDYDGTLPTPMASHLALGPETVFVPADEVVYLIDDGEFSCSAANMGCVEVGLPTFSDDNSLVTSFESAYLLNQPDSFDDILCNDNELFCGEWVTTKAENYYFKDPGNKSCEYKTGVSLNSVSYDGWFRTGTTEFCYGTGVCSGNNTTSCTNDASCASSGLGTCTITNGSYLKNGTLSSLWFSGDEDYDGWAGTCSSVNNYCTEFIDPLDTKENENLEGASYFYLDNDTIDEENNISTDRCNGQISLQEGCALFNDVMSQELTYASSPSYLVSEHADIFFGENPRSFQNPVSCSDPDNGEFTTTTGDSINVCYNRCAYGVDRGSGISNLSVVQGPTDTASRTTFFYGSACVYDTDCQIGVDSNRNEVEGTCLNLDTNNDGSVGTELIFDTNSDGVADTSADLSSYVFADDTNRVIKVYRDRECAEWLACSNSTDAWDERTAQWKDVCQGVDLCDTYETISDEGSCSSWPEDVPTVLNSERYTTRDVSWYGMDYSGFAIPEQLPVQYYDQVNLSTGGYCTTREGRIISTNLIPCQTTAQCNSAASPVCTDVFDLSAVDLDFNEIEINNYHLVYSASSCTGVNGTACTAGYCTNSGNSCSRSEECPGGDCIVGYCEIPSPNSIVCSDDANCPDPYNDCKNGICTDTTTGRQDRVETCDLTQVCSSGADCVPGTLAKTGVCYDNSCLVGIDGNPFDIDEAEDKTCRGYPEISSPFTYQVVSEWINPENLVDSSNLGLRNWYDINVALADDWETYMDAVPYTYVYGFNDATTCTPTQLPDGTYEINNDCLCSYDKAQYGRGAATRYYPLNTPVTEVLTGVCLGGDTPDASCENDSECNPNPVTDDNGTITYAGSGICEKLTRKDIMYGWDGYCIERDTSIQLFGSNANDDLACLSWFPSDQLVGSRNAYANDVDAGYSGGDMFYCAETDAAYNIGTTELGCAESYNNVCNYRNADAWDNFADKMYDDGDCAGSIVCPDGFFAVMTGCGNLSYNESDTGASAMCDNGGNTDQDCPFFCVPKGSYKSEDDSGIIQVWPNDNDYTGKIGEPCLSPSHVGFNLVTTDGGGGYLSDGRFSASAITNREVSLSGGDFMIFLVRDVDSRDSEITFEDDVWEYYNDCVVRGVSQTSLEAFIEPYDLIADIPTSVSGGRGFRDLDTNIGAYAACTSIVKLSQTDPSLGDQFNQAWTNRVWESNPNLYSLEGDYSNYFGYTPETNQTIFGAATDWEIMNEITPVPYPHRIASCIETDGLADPLFSTPTAITNLNADGVTCPSGFSPTSTEEGIDAMPFVTLSSVLSTERGRVSNGDPLSVYCENSNCHICSNDSDCNYGITCNTLTSLCDTGPNIGDECGSDSDCYVLNCEVRADQNNYDSFCNYDISADFSLITSSSESASDLLKQIFARSYGLFEFSEDYLSIGNRVEGPGVYTEWDEDRRGNFDEVTNYSPWIWDITATGDTNGDGQNVNDPPTGPTVASVGYCYDTECLEQNQGKFSVNGFDIDDLSGSNGSYHAALKFFAWANSNQMPIRKVVVDWGSGDRTSSNYSGYNWPLDDQSGDVGSTTGSYYKNRRGLAREDEPVCGSEGEVDEWGLTSEACQTAYFSFEHDYFCSEDFVDELVGQDEQGRCQWADETTGRLLNSPCTGNPIIGTSFGFDATDKCVFQPRVHVQDNWGWCTGYCSTNPDSNGDGVIDEQTTGCYADECDPTDCPSEGNINGNCPDRTYAGIDNPWINYDGVIIVDWAAAQ